MSNVKIVMYHYVRDLERSRYPDIKGLTISEFENQLDFFSQNNTFVRVEDCIEAVYNPNSTLPDNAVLLTFDDGYTEHYEEVFPILDARGIQGAFFPPVQAIMEHKMLDVNKIHFILASTKNHVGIMDYINSRITELAKEFELQEPDYYLNKLGRAEHRYDSLEIIYIKRILQRELPEKPRQLILDELFSNFVEVDENILAKELYMSVDQIKCMLRHGMFIGGHGYSHSWLNSLGQRDQREEVQSTKEFLHELGVNIDEWVMCYPYGAYDQDLINILKAQDCVMGLGTEVGVAELNEQNIYSLKRFDTNDFPKKEFALSTNN